MLVSCLGAVYLFLRNAPTDTFLKLVSRDETELCHRLLQLLGGAGVYLGVELALSVEVVHEDHTREDAARPLHLCARHGVSVFGPAENAAEDRVTLGVTGVRRGGEAPEHAIRLCGQSGP